MSMIKCRLVGKRPRPLAFGDLGSPRKKVCGLPNTDVAPANLTPQKGETDPDQCAPDQAAPTTPAKREDAGDMPFEDLTPSPPPRPPPGVGARLEWRKGDARRKEELSLMRELRCIRDAPVDMLFNLSIADESAAPEVKGFHVFVAVFLSSQTRDEVTAAAMQRLKSRLKGGLTLASVIKARAATLGKLIKPVAFHNVKAKHLKLIARTIGSKHSGVVPTNADVLCELPGIGPKMAHIVVSVLTGNPQGIGIDVHVHRITNKLGWVNSKTPEQTQAQLQKMLPYCEWSDVNVVMVGLGQQMNSARSTLLQRCLQTSDPRAALQLLRKLDFDLGSPDRTTGQCVLHWAALAANREVLQMLLKHVEPTKDNSGLWPWDVACPTVSTVFDRCKQKVQ